MSNHKDGEEIGTMGRNAVIDGVTLGCMGRLPNYKRWRFRGKVGAVYGGSSETKKVSTRTTPKNVVVTETQISEEVISIISEENKVGSTIDEKNKMEGIITEKNKVEGDLE